MKRESTNRRLRVALLAGTFLAIAMAGVNSYAGTLSVNSNADTFTCDNVLTLREAIMLARGNGFDRPLTDAERNLITGGTYIAAPPPVGCPFGAYWSITNGIGGSDDDTIRFSTAVNTISTTGLPIISSGGDTIDGLRSDGVKVALSGVNAGDRAGFWVDIHGAQASRGLTIRNMSISDFQRQGIYIAGGLNGVYEGLEISACGLDGIAVVPIFETFGIYNPRNNRIGGPDVAQRNYIYGNGANGIALYISPDGDRYPNLGNIIENNYIGLNLNGADGNGANGIYLENAFGTLVGDETAAGRNVISANHANGILLTRGGTYANRIINNFIGTGIDGTTRMGNTAYGIRIDQGAGAPSAPNLIGEAGKGNVICANSRGISILDSATNNAVIRGNFIGVDINGNRNDLGNLDAGIFDSNAHDNIIGGIAHTGDENVIAYNGAWGVYATGSTASQINIRANRIFLNALLGIDLDPLGVSLNDPMDVDYGPNGVQNFPLIHAGSSGAGFTNLSGSINSSRNTNLVLDFFINPERDPSGQGEGSFYIGSTSVATDNSGNAVYTVSFNTVLNYSGYYATATATGPEGTSEFSEATRIGCTYNISPTGQNFSAAGGNGTVNVMTATACDWQAVSNASWVQITGGGSGTGNGTVSFSVAANTGPSRTGTITVGRRVFTITQDSLCTYSLSRTSASYPAGGTPSDSLNVTAGNSCTWTAVSNASWITVTSGGSGTGNGTVVWSVAANTGPARQGTITIAGLTFTIDQASGCTFSLINNMASFDAGGGTGAGTVVTESSCGWTAVSNVSWVTITSGANSIGTGPFTYSVGVNVGSPRVGTLTVAGLTYTINQASGCGYQLDHYSASYFAGGTANDTVSVVTASGCPWTAVSNVPWVTIITGSTGTGPGNVTFSVGANIGAARQGTLTIAGLTFTITQEAATIIYVNSTAQAPGAVGDCTLGEAIRAANLDLGVDGCNPGSGPDIISLPAGTYTLSTSAEPFRGNVGLPGITSNIGIQGAGAGSTIIERSPAAIDLFRLMAITNQNSGSIVLNDLTMRGGRTAGSGNQGGALYTFGRSATLNRVVFDDNRADAGGAVITSDQGGVLVANDCVFSNNQAAGSGGAIVSGQMTIARSTFTGNSAVYGGALDFIQGGGANFHITDSTFTNNQASGLGGAIRFGGAATITRSEFTGNSTGPSLSSGGAIKSTGGTLDLIDSVVTGNHANYGGGLHLENSAFTISRSTISNNTASTHFGGGIYSGTGANGTISASSINGNTAGIDGGGIWISNLDLTLANVTIDGNTCGQYGGGIHYQAVGKTLSLSNVTISGNHSALEGGGIRDASGSVVLKNSLIALNTSNISIAPDIVAAPDAFMSLGYNLIGIKDGAVFTNGPGDQTGTLAAPIDPMLGPLQNNGGPTFTRALLPGSTAIDTANPATPGTGGGSCEPDDQRGAPRPFDGGSHGAICDIGSVELGAPVPTPTPTPTPSPTPTPTPTPSCIPGTLDPSFNDDGIVTTPIGNGPDEGRSVAIQGDGKIVVAGTSYNGSNYDFAVARYNSDGSLDTSFNGSGKVTTEIGDGDEGGNSVAIQADGKIVVAGYSFQYVNTDFAVVRYNSDGSLDTSFNGNGKVTTEIGKDDDVGISVAIQSDGKIVVAGSESSFGDIGFAVVRYNSDGSLDNSFNGTGKVVTWFGGLYEHASSVAIQSDGKIVAAGSGSIRDFAVARYNSNGSLDNSFNGTGKVTTDINNSNDFASSVAIQGDGKLVVAGASGPPNGYLDFGVVRYNSNGSLDSSFNGTGKVTTSIHNYDDYGTSAAIQAGKIVVAGRTSNGSDHDIAVVRYNSNGSLDSSFNNTGKVITPIGSGNDFGRATAIGNDGKIVVAGFTLTTLGWDFAVVRYSECGITTGSPTLFDFDGDGKADLSIFRPAVGEWYYQRSSDGVVNGFPFGASTDKPVPADFTGDGKTDVAFFRPSEGNWYVIRSEDSTYFAFPFGLSTDIPRPADYDGDGTADPAVYRPSNSTWYIVRSSDGGVTSVQFGVSTDVPEPADYDGDGKADIAIYRPSQGEWWILRSSNGTVFAATFGVSTDKPVPGDYTGDGKADIAIYRPSEGNWYVVRSEDLTYFAFPFGNSTDKPAPADFDGDGRFDPAVFRPSDTNWYILRSRDGLYIQQFGSANDVPVPGAFVP